MEKDLRPFSHLDWLTGGGKAELDLSYSSISPDWSCLAGKKGDHRSVSSTETGGDRELVDLLARMYGVEEERILLTNGCSGGNTLAFLSTICRGSTILVEKPIYTPLVELPRWLGSRIVFIKRRPDDYKFDLRELERKLASGVDLFIMQNHNNPSGRLLTETELKALASILSKYGTKVLVDEVYLDYTLNHDPEGRYGPQAPSMVQLYDRAMVTSSVTKVYGAGGLMTGWLIGPRRVIGRARRVKVYTMPMVSMYGNRTAKEILEGRERYMPGALSEVRDKLRLVSEWARGRDDVHWSEPDGCAVGFLLYDHNIPSVDFAKGLLRDKGVKVVPGAFFHMEGGIRLGVALDYERLKAALERLDRFLDENTC